MPIWFQPFASGIVNDVTCVTCSTVAWPSLIAKPARIVSVRGVMTADCKVIDVIPTPISEAAIVVPPATAPVVGALKLADASTR